jgi:hypothetical protein
VQVRPVTRPSDVTDWWTIAANPGSSAAAGVVPGAPYLRFSAGGRRRDSNAAEWECGLSRSSPMARRMLLQGSGGPFVYPGGAGCDATTKGLTGVISSVRRSARQCAGPVLWRGGNVVTVDPRGSAGRLWRRTDVGSGAIAPVPAEVQIECGVLHSIVGCVQLGKQVPQPA